MTQLLPIVSPVKGVIRAVEREGQPSESCWDAVNVLPYDRFGRRRVAQRPGLAKQYSTQLGGSDFIQGMIEAPHIIYPPGVLSTPIGGIDDIPGYPDTFTSGTIGPLAGPTTAVSWNGGWVWKFVAGVHYAGNDSSGANLIARFTFPTWLDMGGGPPGVLKGFMVAVKIQLIGGMNTSIAVEVADCTISSPPAFTGDSFFPALAPTYNQNASEVLWAFTMTMDQAGGWTLTDVTNSVVAMGSLANVPTMVPLPSLFSAVVNFGPTTNGTFFITDSN